MYAPNLGRSGIGVFYIPKTYPPIPVGANQAYGMAVGYAANARKVAQGPLLVPKSDQPVTMADKYVETLIAIYSALKLSHDALEWAQEGAPKVVADYPEYMDMILADTEIAERVATTMQNALAGENARALEKIQQDLAPGQMSYVEKFRYIFGQAVDHAKEDIYEPIKEEIKDAIDQGIKQVNKLDWTGIAKIAVPVGVAGLLGWLIIRKM